MNRRQLLGRTAALAVAAACAASALAADRFPSKPVTLIVPFAPGGNLDVVARTLAPALEKALGQNVIVDNRAGAGGAIGASFVARAEADGHTLLVTTPNAVGVLPQMTKTTYKLASFQPVGQIATTPLVVMVRKQSRYADIAALLADARAKPGQISVAHSGPGTTNHIAIFQLEAAANIQLNIVAYKGSGPALVDLIGGQVDTMVDQLSSSTTHIQSGALRPLAVMSRDRDPTLPGVPTLREAGLADFEAVTASGLLAPAGTPAANVETLNAALRKALADPAVAAKLVQLGSPGKPSTAAEWQAQLQQEEKRAVALAASGKLKSD
ncbi:tripartite tricarboxylate transporter substrate binding protein [Xylophilus rhododendri]|uniref:Tripartite tricarboxylate transporter substrate binding protein n=1 Tax=Xylophilus rhododendri TaxID=2697032 RepID=A0A857J482_9BURK|nr:tripartite tricarboxylate transporter substrate binding protein [Xylophilus rhododendri]QHI98754.1 tripartite tricarboxylate transporter substrate binding protein [Xylophilus rhododendri]